MSSLIKSDTKGGIKSKILCKYFIQGKCNKGESCPYLHSKVEKPKEMAQIECPMYNIGFCKNGPLCQFLHIKKEKYTEEKLNEKSTTSTTPINEEENISMNIEANDDKNNNNNKVKEENKEVNNDNKNEILPIWYLEHFFDKPLPLIFSELEQKNLPEVAELKKKYGFTNIQPNLPVFPSMNKKGKMNFNMNTLNLNFNNFNMNFAFNNNKTEANTNVNNTNIIQNSVNMNNQINMIQNNRNQKYGKYEFKKNNIELLIYKEENIFYYMIRCKNMEEIKHSQESNFLSIPDTLSQKYTVSEPNNSNSNLTLILIIYDEETENLTGFARLVVPLSMNEEKNMYKIEWLWRTKLSISKVSHFMNQADEDRFLNEGKNGCEVDKYLGNFCCRLMMKRLTKDELKELENEKRVFESQKKLLNLNNDNNEEFSNNINTNSSNKNIPDININNNLKNDINNKQDETISLKESNTNINNNNYRNNYHSYNNGYTNRKYRQNYDYHSPHKTSNKKGYITDNSSTKNSDYKNKEIDKEKDYKYSGHKRYRSKSKNRKSDSEDYSSSYKYKNNNKYDKGYNNVYNGHSSNNKYYQSHRKDHKDNYYHKYKYDDIKKDFSSKKNYY